MASVSTCSAAMIRSPWFSQSSSFATRTIRPSRPEPFDLRAMALTASGVGRRLLQYRARVRHVVRTRSTDRRREIMHRKPAIVKTVFADLIAGPLAHLLPVFGRETSERDRYHHRPGARVRPAVGGGAGHIRIAVGGYEEQPSSMGEDHFALVSTCGNCLEQPRLGGRVSVSSLVRS